MSRNEVPPAFGDRIVQRDRLPRGAEQSGHPVGEPIQSALDRAGESTGHQPSDAGEPTALGLVDFGPPPARSYFGLGAQHAPLKNGRARTLANWHCAHIADRAERKGGPSCR
jgi:hypothetical protein